MPALIIDIDEFKKTFAGYDPNMADQFHTESAKMANKEYEQSIKKSQYEEVILLCGGSASGKTEFIDSYLKDKSAIIFDSTLSSNEGAKNKVRPALKKKKKISIYFIQPYSVAESYISFLNRERQFPVEHFIRTHSGARDTFWFLMKKYPELNFYHIISKIAGDNKPKYYLIQNKLPKMLQIIQGQQLTSQDITDIIATINQT